jgi:hypothetical protein
VPVVLRSALGLHFEMSRSSVLLRYHLHDTQVVRIRGNDESEFVELSIVISCGTESLYIASRRM